MIFYLKILAFLPGIGILMGMLTHFFGFYSLAACVAAAVSQSKKTVSAAAAAVVGVGLLCSPIDSVQANHGQSTVPTVLSVDIDTDAESVSWEMSFGWLNGYCRLVNSQSVSSPVIYAGGYFQVTLYPYLGRTSDGRPVCLASKWIEIWVWMGDDDSEPSAYVYDSEGNFYSVDLYIDDYGPWPTW